MIIGTINDDTLTLGYGEAQDVDGLGGTDTVVLENYSLGRNGLSFVVGSDPASALTLVHPGGDSAPVSSMLTSIEFLQLDDIQIELVVGSFVADALSATGAADAAWLFGGDGADTLTGTGQDDHLRGGFGADVLTGGGGSDEFFSKDLAALDVDGDVITDFDADDSVLFGGQFWGIGSFTFTQGLSELTVGVDTNFDTLPDVTFSLLGDYTSVLGDFRTEITAEGTRLTFAPEVAGTAGADTLTGTIRNDVLDGADGDDVIFGGVGNDLIIGGAGIDQLTGGAGRDTFRFDPLSDAGLTPDIILDFEAGDTIQLGGGGLTNEDVDLPITFIGSAAFSGVAGEVRTQDGSGIPSLAVPGVTQIQIDTDGDLIADHLIDLFGAGQTLRATGPGSPTLELDVATGFISEFDDVIAGTQSNDVYDTLGGSDTIRAMAGDDIVFAGDGDDFITDGLGDDTIDGGNGFDVFQRFYGEGPVHVQIRDTSVTELLTGEVDSLTSIERIAVTQRLAAPTDDILDASAVSAGVIAQLFGGGGDDLLMGGAANDGIEGDRGTDILFGGLGADRFTFDYLAEIQDDLIKDFETGDTLELTLIEFVAEEVMLTFIGTDAFSGVAGEYRYFTDNGQTIVEIDTIGDLAGDKRIIIDHAEVDLFDTVSGLERLGVVVGGIASSGDDDLTGTNSDDTLDALDGNDRLNGFAGDDDLRGGIGDDTLVGGLGADVMNGGSGADRLFGGDGDDVFTDTEFLPTSNNDLYDGGAGDDTLVQDLAMTGVTFDLTAGRVFVGISLSPRDTLISIENLTVGGDSTMIGSEVDNRLVATNSFANTIEGRGGDDMIDAAGGDDTIAGGEGRDIITGGQGADDIDGGAGFDTASYRFSGSAVTVDLMTGVGSGGDAAGDTLASIERLIGSDFNDMLTGDGRSNRLEGRDGDDMLDGSGGNDQLIGGIGADLIDGGAGLDAAFYNDSVTGVTVNLQTGTYLGDTALGDVLVNVERLVGSGVDDVLTADSSLIWLEGGAGDDVITGGTSNNLLFGGIGADTIDGGAGRDNVYYIRSTEGVTVNLASGVGIGGEAQGDTLTNVENVVGSQLDDILIGDAGINNLQGRDGDDVLSGGAGDDILRGFEGADTFLMAIGSDKERVRDFEDGVDKFDVSAFGLSATAAVSLATTFGTGVVLNFGGGARLIVENTTVAEITVDDFLV